MRFLEYRCTVLAFFAIYFVKAQDCTLDVGGGNKDVIVSVFQLNKIQKEKLDSLKVNFDVIAKGLEDKMERLMASHPQSTPQELITFGDKYIVLQDEMVDAAMETDKMLLSIFNKKQYERYLELCQEALRKPIVIKPLVYNDSLGPK